MNKIATTIIKKLRIEFLSLLILAGLLLWPSMILAGLPFYADGTVYVNRGNVKVTGDNTTENSKANAFVYRSNIVGQSTYSLSPETDKIYPAEGGSPAYTDIDVGSSVWTTPPTVGDDMYVVLETRAGLNGWVGPSYVAGSHTLLTASDLSNIQAFPPEVVMEAIPTPTMAENTQTSVTITFPGLIDRTNVPGQGSWNNAVVGYTIYRSINNTSNPIKIATVAQSAAGGGTISYTDNDVAQGVSYYYQLAVNYRWSANTPNPWYETIARGPWSTVIAPGEAADAVKFTSTAINANSTVKAGPITISTYNLISGDIGSPIDSVTLNLTSNSSGQSRFYPYIAGSCSTIATTTVTIPSGQSSASFCYSDTLAGVWTITAAPTNGWEAIMQAGQTITVGPLDHFTLDFQANQTNDVVFTGTNTISARDAGNNSIVNFASQGLGATVSASGGAVVNNTIAAADFVDGVANLTAKNFKYTGPKGNVTLTVTASNGKNGAAVVNILPGSLQTVRLRTATNGGGNIIANQALTVDGNFNIFAAGYDVSNNYIADINGTWGVTGNLDNKFSGSSSNVTFAPDQAPTSGTITFTDGSSHDAATGQITVSHGVLAGFSIASTTNNQIAGQAFDLGQITAVDAKGNQVLNYAATVALSDTTGTVNPSQSAVFINGRLDSQLVTITKAQAGVAITLTDAGKSVATNNFTVSHGELHHFQLNLTSPQNNDQVWTGSNSLVAQDQWNNTLIDYNSIGTAVTLTVASGTIANAVIDPADFSGGSADLTAKNLKYTGPKGSVTIAATSATTNKVGTSNLTINPGNVNKVVIRNAANNGGSEQGNYELQVGQNLVLYAAAYDVSNNYIADINGTWGRTGTLDAPSSGLLNAINYQPMTAYTNGALTFDDGQGHTDSTGQITVNRGPLHHFQLDLASPQTNGIAFSGTSNLVAKDVGNNTITDFNNIGSTVTLTATGPGTALQNNIINKSNFSAGVANLAALGFTYIGQAGTTTITATSENNKTGSAEVAIAVGGLHHFDFTLTSNQLINTAFTGTNSIVAKDIGNNTITNFSALVDNVTLTASPQVTVGGLAGPTHNVLLSSDDFQAGICDLTGRLTHPGPSGSYVLTATSASNKKGDSNAIEIDVGPLHHFGFQTIGAQRAGQPFTVNVLAYAQDPQGNSHIKATYNGQVSLTDTSGTVTPVTIGPFINGQATAELTITKAIVGNVLTVKDKADQNITGISNAFTVQNGSLHHFAVNQTLGNQVAGAGFNLGRLEARDQWENVVQDFTATATLSDNTGTLTPSTTAAFVNGVLNDQAVTITKTVVGNTIAVKAQDYQGVSNIFNVNPGALAAIKITDQAGLAGLVVADRVISTDDNWQLFSVGFDAFNNYIGEVPVRWSVTGDLDPLEETVRGNIIYSPQHAPRLGTITIDDQSGHQATTGQITIKNGLLASFGFTIPTEQRVGLPLTATSTLAALDAKGNIVVDFNATMDNVTIAASTGGAISGLGALSDNIINTAPSFVNGVADLRELGLIYGGQSGAVTLTALSASGKGGTSPELNFSVGPLHHFELNLAGVQANSAAFNGENSVRAVDLGGNAIVDFNASLDPLTVTVLPDNGLISGLSGNNSLNKAADFTAGVSDLTNKLTFTGLKGPHTFIITSESGKTGTSSQVEILPGALSYLQIRNAPGGNGGVIGNGSLRSGDALQLYAAGYDSSNNFIQDQTVAWIGTGVAANFLTPVNGPSTVFNATVPGSGTINATIGNLLAQTGTITVEAGQAAKLVFLSKPYDGNYGNNQPVIANQASGKIVAQLQDVVGNVIPATSERVISLASSGAGEFSASADDWQATTQLTMVVGQSQVEFYYRSGTSGNQQLTAATTDNISSASQAISILPYYDKSLVFATLPQAITAGSISGVIKVELRNQTGQLATSSEPINIRLLSNSQGDKKFYFDEGGSAEITTLNLPAGKSSISFYYQDSIAGQVLLHVQGVNVTDGFQAIQINPGQPQKLLIVPGPTAEDGQNIIQNYASEKITVRLLDQYNNPVEASSDVTVHLSSANLTGDFAGNETLGRWVNTNNQPEVKIVAGESEGYFYYRDSTLGAVEITASVQPEHAWDSAHQIETIYAPVISKLAFITPTFQRDTNVVSPVITIQAQDALGNAIAVSEDTEISLITSDSANGNFALSPTGPWTATKVVIPAGSAVASFYYRDSFSGTKNIGISETPSLGWADAVQAVTINAGAPAKLAFVSTAQTIAKNVSSGAIIVQLQDAQSQPTVAATDLTINLTTDSAGGAFTNNSVTGPWGLGSITLPTGSHQVVFYYRDQQPGTYTLNAAVVGHNDWQVSQLISITEGVITKLGFVSEPQSIAANATSTAITIQTQNNQGDPVKVTADTIIALSSNSATGQFAVATSTAWGASQITIPAGSSTATFYYRDTSSGTMILSASESPSKDWTDAAQQIVIGSVENNIAKLAFKTASQTGASAVPGGELSQKITVETRSILDNPVNVNQTTYVVISANSQTGRFTSTSTEPLSNSLVLTLQPGQSSADFYYVDTVQGNFLLQAAEFPSIGWIDAEQAIEVTSGNITQLAIITPIQSVLKDRVSDVITLATRDVYGNLQKVNQDTVIRLATNSGTGTFYRDAAGEEAITSITINANQSTASFYYYDRRAGSYTIVANEDPDTNWTSASQAISVTENQLAALVIRPDYSLLPTETNTQLTAVGYNAAGEPIPDLEINWEVANPAAGQINDSGVLTTKDSVGVYQQTVRASAGGQTAYATVEVYQKPVAPVDGGSGTTSNNSGSSGGGGFLTVIEKVFVKAEPPTNVSLIINDEAKITTKQTVNLSLYATGASYFKVSEKPDFSDVKDWRPYQSTVDFKLSDGYGRKTVYVKYRSASNDESPVVSRMINYQKPGSSQIDADSKDNPATNPADQANETEPKIVTRTIEKIIRDYNYVILSQKNSDLPLSLPTVISPAPNAYVLQKELMISGQAPANTIVTLHIHSPKQVTVKVVTDSDGKFVYRLDESKLDPGEHQIYATIDQTSGSLVGPAVNFNLLAQADQADLSTMESIKVFGTSFWSWFLGLWLAILATVLLGLVQIMLYAKRANRPEFGFLFRWPILRALLIFGGLTLVVFAAVAIVIIGLL